MRKRVMPPSRKKLNSKPAVTTHAKENDAQTNHRGKRLWRNVPLQQHTQVMREAKRLREQIRVRAVNAEYTHLNETLGLKDECPSLPKISKQQTLKTCISHIKLLREELSTITGQPQGPDIVNQEKKEPLKLMYEPETNSQMYIPSFPVYMPSLYPYPLPPPISELDGYSSMDTRSFSSDDLAHYDSFQYTYPCTDTDYESMAMTGQHEEDGSGSSDLHNVSETFSSELFTDFPNYSDSFCSTPDTPSSPYSWFLPQQWSNLDDN